MKILDLSSPQVRENPSWLPGSQRTTFCMMFLFAQSGVSREKFWLVFINYSLKDLKVDKECTLELFPIASRSFAVVLTRLPH